ncbi:hypothetical protein ACO2Q1_02245 [Brevundimonas sp. VNH65]|uniref:hypothetical protein n=1 Tax=Brevundimonas sp. VNH65 TaxID=3400917 RepID=UPI003C0BEFB9
MPDAIVSSLAPGASTESRPASRRTMRGSPAAAEASVTVGFAGADPAHPASRSEARAAESKTGVDRRNGAPWIMLLEPCIVSPLGIFAIDCAQAP